MKLAYQTQTNNTMTNRILVCVEHGFVVKKTIHFNYPYQKIGTGGNEIINLACLIKLFPTEAHKGHIF